LRPVLGSPRARGSSPEGLVKAPSPARLLALRVLGEVLRGGVNLAERLAAPDASRLDPRERAFLHELVLGTLRLRGGLDHALGPHLDRPVGRVDAVPLDILRLGAHQILHLRVPDRAAVSESVELAKAVAPRAAGFVNAVLRALVRTGSPAEPDPGRDPKRWLTTVGSLPEWLADRWLSRLGPVVAVARARALLSPSPSAFRLNPRVPEGRQRCEEAGLTLVPLTIPGAFRAEGGRLADLASDGVLYLQDQGSQLVAHLAGGSRLTLDACAAPGGKATLMADLAGQHGRVVAAEVSPRRVRSMAMLFRSWGSPRLDLVLADGARPPFAPRFDSVLIDAPCSGLGTLGRHPDIRWRAKAEDIPRHAERQGKLLAALAPLVRSGGRVVYATCSLEEEETTAVVLGFLGRHPDFRAGSLPVWAEPYSGSDGFVRTLPERDPGDGFFAAVLERG
jgi:16S rRNA (cytosine967-C5)-methyltransferase